jgi:hypothetical protein
MYYVLSGHAEKPMILDTPGTTVRPSESVCTLFRYWPYCDPLAHYAPNFSLDFHRDTQGLAAVRQG